MNKIDKAILENEYINNEKSMQNIANEYNMSVGTIYNYIKRYNIKSRKHLTEKSKNLISLKNKGRVSARRGIKLSKETKDKIRIGHLGKYRTGSVYGGHRKRRSDGYIAIYIPTHKNATKDGYVMEHILVMENHIGRLLEKDEVVHHKNKIRDDNRIENLQLMTFKEHARLHIMERYNLKRGVMTY